MLGNLFSKKPVPPARNPVKEVLFGDLPLDQWPRSDAPSRDFPWSNFVNAREDLKSGRAPQAIALWQQVLSTPDLEPLQYVQAWHFLRQNGVNPSSEDAKKVFGVIVEIGSSGVLVAAYSDRQARMYSDSGNGVVWLRPDGSLDSIIDALFEIAAQVVLRLGPWDKSRLAMPSGDIVRISFLTPSGLHFGQGPSKAFSEDPLAGPVLKGSSALMRALIQKSENKPSGSDGR
jgi:hypothetical protein